MKPIKQHLNRCTRTLTSRNPMRITMFVTALCPELRPFKGVIYQYLCTMDKQIHAEGIQGVARFKAYKSDLLKICANKYVDVERSHYAKSLLRVALKFRDNTRILTMLHTVMRSYDLYVATPKEVQKELRAFERDMLSPPEEVERKYSYDLDGDNFNVCAAVRQLFEVPHMKEVLKRLNSRPFYEPEEGASLLTKSGTVRVVGLVDLDGAPIPKVLQSGYLPSIVGAPIEHAKACSTRITYSLPVRGKWTTYESSYADLIKRLQDAIGECSNPSMRGVSIATPSEITDSVECRSLRRSAAFGSNGGKVRVIGISDYLTQYTLSPIHRYLFRLLRGIPSDYTFSHSRGFDVLSRMTLLSPYVACFDLSKATDNFPAFLQRRILSLALPNGGLIANLWYAIMTAPFFNGKSYKVGQPMGLLSSWSAFAFSHHVMVWLASHMAGILPQVVAKPQSYYGIVGDDLFIADGRIAHYYSIIMNAIGVKVNLSKSLIVHKDNRVSEFVKRNSLNGNEISAISPKLICQSFDSVADLINLINKIQNRVILRPDAEGLPIPWEDVIQMYEHCGSVKLKPHSISRLVSIPQLYGGLGLTEESLPPVLHFRLLEMVVKTAFKWSLRSSWITDSGVDIFDKVSAACTSNFIDGQAFQRYYLATYLRKLNMDEQSVYARFMSIKTRVLSLMEELANELSVFPVDHIVSFYEKKIMAILEEIDPPEFKLKRVSKREMLDRSRKALKLIESYEDLTCEFSMEKLDTYLTQVIQRYTLYEPPATSSEDFADIFASLFKDVPNTNSDLSDSDVNQETPDDTTSQSLLTDQQDNQPAQITVQDKPVPCSLCTYCGRCPICSQESSIFEEALDIIPRSSELFPCQGLSADDFDDGVIPSSILKGWEEFIAINCGNAQE